MEWRLWIPVEPCGSPWIPVIFGLRLQCDTRSECFGEGSTRDPRDRRE